YRRCQADARGDPPMKPFPSFPAFCLAACAVAATAGPLPPSATFRDLPRQAFEDVKRADEAAKAAVMGRQRDLLARRYDLADRPMPGVMMSGGRKPVQGGVRVRLPAGTTWERLAAMTPQ